MSTETSNFRTDLLGAPTEPDGSKIASKRKRHIPSRSGAADAKFPASPTSAPNAASIPMDERYLTVGEVAKRFGVSRPTNWRWAKAGGFPSPFEVSSGTTR